MPRFRSHHPVSAAVLLGAALAVTVLAAPTPAQAQAPHAQTRGRSAAARIEAARRAGAIGRDEAMRLKALSVYRPERLPRAYHGGAPGRDATPVLLEIERGWHRLKPATRRAIAAYKQGGGAGARKKKKGGGGGALLTDHFRIVYSSSGGHAPDPTDADGNGHPDWVDEAGAAAELSFDTLVTTEGWPEPPYEDRQRYEIEIRSLNAYYGYTEGITFEGDNYQTPDVTELNAYTTRIVVDNDYAGFPGDPLSNLRATIAHEYAHALQGGLDWWEEIWWMENTATSIEDDVYPGIHANLFYIDDYADDPDTSHEANDEYGGYLLPRHMTERLGHGTLLACWLATVGYDSYFEEHALDAIRDGLLASQGATLSDVFTTFAGANGAIPFAGVPAPYAYADAALYPSFHVEGGLTAGAAPATWDSQADGNGRLQPRGADYLELDGASGGAQVRVDGDAGAGLFALLIRDTGSGTAIDELALGQPFLFSSPTTAVLVVGNRADDGGDLAYQVTLEGEVVEVTDIAVTKITAPSSAEPGADVTVDVRVANAGNQDVPVDIGVTLVHAASGQTIGTQTIGGLAPGESALLSFTWDTAGFGEGDHVLTASHGVADENAANDEASTTVTLARTPPPPPPPAISLTASGYKVKGRHKVDLSWSGATSASVDVYRDGERIATTSNDGFYHDAVDNRGGATYVYRICEAGDPDACSNDATVDF